MQKQKLIVIVGSTASGKSDLAVFLAKKFNGEIVSADSRQVYKWMNIGTGKVTEEEMQGVPHHLLDVAHPSRQFTVTQYKKKAEAAIRKIHKKNKLPILIGGTGFYVDSVVYNINFPEVPPNKELRKKLEKLSAEELFEMLKEKDSARAKTIQKENKRRLIRAIEIITETGKPVPKETRNKEQDTKYDTLIIGINIPREELDEKIGKRLDARLQQGMIEEVKELREQHGVSWRRLENFGLEYRWIARYLQGKIPREDMKEELYKDIKRYARRQMTWFKRDKNIKWITLQDLPAPSKARQAGKEQLQIEAEKLTKDFIQK